MLGLTLASLRARPLRALLTAFSIVLGVAMISGTFVVTGQINRAFSEIFDAVNVKNDVVDLSADGERQQQRLPGALLELRPESCRQGAGRRRDDRRDRRARLARHLQERQAQARQLRRRRPSARLLDTAGALRSGAIRARAPSHARRRDRADRGHGQEGQGRYRLDGRPRHAGRAQAPARRRHLPDRHDGVARRRAHQLDPAQGRPALVLAGRAVHPGQRSDGAGRLQDDAARPHPRSPRQPLQGANRPEKAKADSQGIADQINGFLGPALLAFGGVAVLVGAFIIFNMFSITVAQRIREIAMLRTLGASRKQILTSVLLEALTTGLLGTIIGIFAGLLIALGINALFDAVGLRPAVDLAAARDHGRRARARRGTRRDARLGADPRGARDQDPADGGPARGRDAAARALRALVADPRGPLRTRRRGADRQRRDRIRHGQPAPARHGRRRGADLPRRRHDRALRRAGPGPHRRRAAGLARERVARARQRDAQCRAHGAHRRGAHDRRGPRGLRGRVRRGPAHIVHERARQVAQERSDRHADGSERRRHALAADRAGARGHSRRRGRVVADAGRHPPGRQARRPRQRALRHPAGDDRQGLQGHVGHGQGLRSQRPERQRDPAREGRGLVAAREGRRSRAAALELPQARHGDRARHLQGRHAAAERHDHDASPAPPDGRERRPDRARDRQAGQRPRAGRKARG